MSRQTTVHDACPHEQAIVDLVVAGRRLDESDDALRAHAAECRACAETLELARLLQDDQKALCEEAPVPSAGAVWWRATIRARAEAARAAGQPITLLQGIRGGDRGGSVRRAWPARGGARSLQAAPGSSASTSSSRGRPRFPSRWFCRCSSSSPPASSSRQSRCILATADFES